MRIPIFCGDVLCYSSITGKLRIRVPILRWRLIWWKTAWVMSRCCFFISMSRRLLSAAIRIRWKRSIRLMWKRTVFMWCGGCLAAARFIMIWEIFLFVLFRMRIVLPAIFLYLRNRWLRPCIKWGLRALNWKGAMICWLTARSFPAMRCMWRMAAWPRMVRFFLMRIWMR